jgi:beta-galactosidase
MTVHDHGLSDRRQRLGRQATAASLVAAVLTLSLLALPSIAASKTTTASQPGAVPAASPRPTIDLSKSWRFHLGDVPGADAPTFDDTTWAKTDLPHTWNAQDAQDGGGDYHRGIGWYRKTVKVPASLDGRPLFLEFGGAGQVAEVYVNGALVGHHEGAFGLFRVDVTEALADGGSVAVKVDNSLRTDVAPLAGDFNVYGGLYRGVRLVSTAITHLDMLDSGGPGVIIRQRSLTDAAATIDVTSRVENPDGADLLTTVIDRRGRVVASETTAAGTAVSQRLEVPRPHRWDGTADPYLYRIRVSVVRHRRTLDAVTQPLGLRTITIDPARGLFLNGRPYQVHGVNRHQDWENVGWATTRRQTLRDFTVMREMGVNAIRLAHYPQDDFVYELADRFGILLYSEVPYVGGFPSPPGSNPSPGLTSNLVAQAREAVRALGNHPSIAWWGIGNELADTPDVNANLEVIEGTIKAEDSTRQTSYAHLSGLYPDSSSVLDHADLSAYNRYDGWYFGFPSAFGSWADALHATDPGRPIGITEYGAGASVQQHQEWPGTAAGLDTSKPHPEEYQAYHHSQLWQQINSRPYLWGSFVWAMFDFASDARHEGDHLGRNDKGLVTADRNTRKAAFYYFKSAWTQTPTVRIVEKRWERRSDASTTVHVFSNAPSVTLRINGVVKGRQSVVNHTAAFPVQLRPGDNRVIAQATKRGHDIHDTATWRLVDQS